MSKDKYIPGMGPLNAKIMIVGDCPTYKDLETGKPFSASRELDILLKEAGISRDMCWLTNVSKYIVGPSGKKKIPFHVRAKRDEIDIDKQIYDLQEEVNAIKPNTIIALGNPALWALTGKTGIQSYRGSILHGMGRKVIPTYNPRDLNYHPESECTGYWNRPIILFDLKRAIKQSQFADFRLPSRLLSIARNSQDFKGFLDRHKNKTKPAVDIEAGGMCIPICIGLSFTPSEGITVPLWNKDGISNIPDSELVILWGMLADVLANYEIVGQNFKYDQDKIKRLGFIIRRLASDTMLKAFAINPELPVSLGFNTSIYTEEPYYKDEGMYFGKIEDLLLGCARDACVTKEVDLAQDKDIDELGTRDYYENFILRLHELYLDIENTGFRIDQDARLRLLRKYIEWDEKLNYERFQLTGEDVNPNSWRQVQELLYEKLKLPAKKGTSEEDLTALLNHTKVKNQKHRDTIENILIARRVRKSISTYMMALPDFDMRMKTTYFLCLKTGRTSTGMLEPPIRPSFNIKKGEWGQRSKSGSADWKDIGIAFQTMTKHGDVGADIREMYIPDDGEVFLQADSSQAEARVIFLLADDEQALKDIDTHDYHALTASWFFGGTEDDHSKKKLGFESPIRFAGKTLRHAGHLGAGKRRAAIELNTQARKYKIPININEATAERALKIFHSKQPKIQQVFQAGIIDCLQKTRRLAAGVPYGIKAKIGGVRTFYERWGDELNREAFSYIPQRSVSDNTKAAALRIKRRIPSIKIVMESHDALLFSIPETNLVEWSGIIVEEMERPIRFDTCSLSRRELVIPCEVETGYNYCDLKKFKDVPLIRAPEKQLVIDRPKSIQEQFEIITIPRDTKLDKMIPIKGEFDYLEEL